MDAVKELVFRFPVYRREGVIQNNEGAAVIEEAGYHDPGLLASGKAEPSFTYHCFDALGKGGGLFGKAGTPQRFVQISFFSKPYILFQGGIEELHGMAHIAYERQGGYVPAQLLFAPGNRPFVGDSMRKRRPRVDLPDAVPPVMPMMSEGAAEKVQS